MTTTPSGIIVELGPRQASPELTINAFMEQMDIYTGPKVLSMALTTPPGSPANGDAYIPAQIAGGVWTGKEDYIAYYRDGWKTMAPRGGNIVFDANTKVPWCYSSTETEWYPLVPLWSVTEHWTGQYGSGGTKLYSKVIDIGALPNNTNKNTAHGITNINIGEYIHCDGWVDDGTDATNIPLALRSGASNIFAELYVNATNVRTETNANLTSWSGKVRLLYERT